MNRICLALTAASLILATGLSPVQAEVKYWDITGPTPGATNGDGIADGTWDAAATNWNTDATGGAGGAISAWTSPLDDAVFSAGNDVGTDPTVAGAFITVGGTQVANSILIEDGYVAFRSGTADVDTGTITVNAGATLDIDSALRVDPSGSAAGKVVLSGGTMKQSNPGQAGSFIFAARGLEINGTGTVMYDDGDGIADNKVSVYTGVITGTGGTTTNGGAGTLIKTGPDQIGIGASDLDPDPVGVTPSHTLFTFAKLVVEEGAYRARNVGTVVAEQVFGAVPLAELPDAITLNGGGIGTNATVTLHANRGITIGTEGGYLDHGAGGGLTIPGPITGSAMLTIGSASHVGTTVPNPTFALGNTNNANTFTGKVTVLRGTLSVADAAAIGAAPGSFVADSITISGAVATAGGSSTLTFTGTTTLSANRGITLEGTTDGRINIPSGGNTLTYDGVISGPGKFIKMGDGTLTTAGAHTYGGGTDVYGRLLVNNTSGSGTGTGAVAVKTTAAGLGANGTLGGTGSVSGLVTVESGGSIAPGAATGSIGNLTLAGGLTLDSGSVLGIDLGAPTMGDLINVGGTTTINGGTVNVNNAGGLAAGTYTILDYAGALGGSFSNLVMGTTPAGFTINLVDTGSAINLSVIGGPVGVPGDYNNNGTVDAADYVLWRNGGPLQNEVDTPGTVNQADYDAWRARFGNTQGAGSGSSLTSVAVPEPATLAMLIAAIGLFAAGRRER